MKMHFFSKKNKTISAEILSFKKKGNKKQALLIYTADAVKHWLEGNYLDENFNSHSMHWESIEMVRLLNENGFDVDYADCTKPLPEISWSKYDLVLDERSNFYGVPEIKGQHRIFYATGCHWMFQNLSEWERLYSFRERTGISLPSMRQTAPLLCEATADVVTYFGGDFQKELFTNPSKTFPLALSSSFVPDFRGKNINTARHNFLWMGSRGLIHKGLDIVLEAFKQLKDQNLHICARLEAEPGFYDWFKKEFSDRANIIYHGWKNVHDEEFQHIAENCIGTVCSSASEGGAGAVIQAMQFGCIPITNKSTALRGGGTGITLTGNTPAALISETAEAIRAISNMPEPVLKEKSAVVREYAHKEHSRNAYGNSFTHMLALLDLG